VVEGLAFHVINHHLWRRGQRLAQGGADDEITKHRIVRNVPVPSAPMLQQLPNGHGARARITNSTQIQDVTDRLIETELSGLDQLQNTDGSELR
jgi:hypothetical protein